MELAIRSVELSQPQVEVVERKGIGHPDTICDALAERICVELCRYYLEHFGAILHHNVDKILLCGGAARPAFGGGEIDEPIELYLTGRVTGSHDGQCVPAEEIAVEACRQWLRDHLPGVDADRNVRIVPRFREGSSSLTSLFKKAGGAGPACNDTSCGAGFAPLTPLEKAVLEIEGALNSAATKKSHPAIGQDVKVMGVRNGSHTHFTVACAMIGKHLRGIGEYRDAKELVRHMAIETAGRFLHGAVDATVNAADDLAGGDVYLTVTGTSAESGDDGEVGRGNRVSGLITPCRPMTMEAAAGKNPVSHVGKLYNLAAGCIAKRTSELFGVRSSTCLLVSEVGRAVSDPALVDLCVQMPAGVVAPAGPIEWIVREELSRFPELLESVLAERARVY